MTNQTQPTNKTNPCFIGVDVLPRLKRREEHLRNKLSPTGAKEILPERLQAMVGCRIPLPSQHAGRIVVTAQGTRSDGRRGEMGRVLERHADIGTVTKEMLEYMVDGGLKNPVCSVTYVSDKWFPQLNDHYRTAVDISIEEDNNA